jgi:tetratricopeptide (TPR) repeat protein
VEPYDHAIGYFQESLTLAQQLSAPLRLIIQLTTWGETELFHGQFATARQHFLEVLALNTGEEDYPEVLARAYYGLANIALREKNIRKAREHAAESARLFKQIGHYKAQEVQAWVQALPKERTMLPEPEQV